MANIIKRNNSNMPATAFSGLVDSVFQNTLSSFFDDNFWGFNGLATRNPVPVNIRETDKTYEMELMAPGLKKEDFKIEANGDMLTVSYEHKEDHNEENKDEGWLRREHRMQSFSRSFSLDDTVNANGIAAKYTNGI